MKNSTLRLLLAGLFLFSAIVIFGQSTTKSYTSTVKFSGTNDLQLYNAIRMVETAVKTSTSSSGSSAGTDTINQNLRAMDTKLSFINSNVGFIPDAFYNGGVSVFKGTISGTSIFKNDEGESLFKNDAGYSYFRNPYLSGESIGATTGRIYDYMQARILPYNNTQTSTIKHKSEVNGWLSSNGFNRITQIVPLASDSILILYQ